MMLPGRTSSLLGLALLMVSATAMLSGCSRAKQDTTHITSKPIETTAERGPVKLIVRAEQGELTVGERTSLTIDVLFEPNVDVKMPEIAEKLGSFDVEDRRTPPDIPEAGKRRWTHQYTIRTLDTGDVEIPPVTVKFTDRRNQGDARGEAIEGEISSDKLTVNIRSLIAGEPNPDDLRDIKDAVDVPVPWHARAWWYAAGGAALLAMAAVFWLIRRRGRKASAAIIPELPPHLWALRQLDQLAADRLIERGELEPFFFRLSTIVRQYIERRFAIMAAEQTTDEFLREARRHPTLDDSQRALLADFLRLADMVKFARFQPQRDESEQALAAARNFVQQTAPRLQSELPQESPMQLEPEPAA